MRAVPRSFCVPLWQEGGLGCGHSVCACDGREGCAAAPRCVLRRCEPAGHPGASSSAQPLVLHSELRLPN